MVSISWLLTKRNKIVVVLGFSVEDLSLLGRCVAAPSGRTIILKDANGFHCRTSSETIEQANLNSFSICIHVPPIIPLMCVYTSTPFFPCLQKSDQPQPTIPSFFVAFESENVFFSLSITIKLNPVERPRSRGICKVGTKLCLYGVLSLHCMRWV